MHDGAFFKPILALHITHFSSCQNYWGESIWGRGCHASPPPPPGSTPRGEGGGGACQLKICVPPYENLRPPPPPQCPPYWKNPSYATGKQPPLLNYVIKKIYLKKSENSIHKLMLSGPWEFYYRSTRCIYFGIHHLKGKGDGGNSLVIFTCQLRDQSRTLIATLF